MAFKFTSIVTTLAFLAFSSTHAGTIGQHAITYLAPVVSANIANPAHDAVVATHQNVVRSFGGTVSQYSKAVDTPYSSVHKEDTRITNNVYTPTLATKTVSYAAAAPPVPVASTLYTTHHHHQQQKQEQQAVEQAHVVYEQHEYSPVYQQHQPAHTYEQHVQHEVTSAPATAPAAVYHHQHQQEPVATAFYTTAPAAAQISTKTVHYAAPESAHNYRQQQHQQQHHQVQHHQQQQKHEYQHKPQYELNHQPAIATTTTTYTHGPDASTYSHNAPGIAAYGTSQTVHYSPAEMVSHMSFDGFGTHWGF